MKHGWSGHFFNRWARGAPTRQLAALPFALLLLVAAVLVVQGALQPAPASPRGPVAPTPAQIAHPGQFASARAAASLATILGDEAPHPQGSEAGAAVARRIADHLHGLGLAPELHLATACGRRTLACGRVTNVVARLPGGDPAAPALLLSAHHDSVAAGPGASDDGSGVATLLELARIATTLGPDARRRPWIFLFVDGEEYGLLGAEAFLQTHPWAGSVAYAINLDSGGHDGLATLTRISAGGGPVIAALARAWERPRAASITTTAYALTPYDTDFTAYDRAGITALDLGIGEDKAVYHTPLDRLVTLDRGSLQHLGEAAVAAAFALDQLADPPPPEAARGGERVYLDLLGRALWTAPAAILPGISAGLLLGLLGLLGLLRRVALRGGERPWSARSWAWGIAAWPLITAVALLGAAAFAWLLAAIAGAESASYADPRPLRLALWAAVLGLSGLIAGILGRRAPPLTLWAGSWGGLAVGTLGLAIAAPGASVALLPPVAAQVLIAALALALTRGRRLPTPAIVAGLAIPALLWVDAALRLGRLFGLGRDGAVIALAPIALWAALLAPLWSTAPRRLRRGLLGLLGVLALGAGALSAALPAHSPSRPRRLNLVLHHDGDDGDNGERRWLADAPPGPLPAALRRIVPFAETPAPGFAWSPTDDRRWIAPAAAEPPLPPPTLELVADHPGPWGRLLRLHLRSPRKTRQAALLLPAEVELHALAIDGVTLPRSYPEAKRERFPGYLHYAIVGLPPEGVTVDLVIAAGAPQPLPITIWDLADGLPPTAEATSLTAARPPNHVPSHNGDRTLVSQTQYF